MTRILYWNIQNFSCNQSDQNSVTKFTNRVNFIIKYIFGNLGNTPPDIICIVEGNDQVCDMGKTNGQLLSNDKVINAILTLLTCIQIARNSATEQWCLVPPLCSGEGRTREPTTVFYNSAKLNFTGPCAWQKYNFQGADIEKSIPLQDVNDSNNLVAYPPLFHINLPDRATTIPIPNSNPAAFFNENQLAAKCVAGSYPDRVNRQPYLTTFTERNNPNGNRNLNIYTIHTSPSTAVPAMWKITSKLLEQTPNLRPLPLPDNNVNIILGDFNVDTVDDQCDPNPYSKKRKIGVAQLNVYKEFINNGYTIHLWPGTKGSDREAIKSYCMTHLLSLDSATPYRPQNQNANTTAQSNYYPRYGYMGSGSNSDSGAIDNVMTKYAANLQAPNNRATNMTIINPIVGSPYNRINNPPNVPVNLTQGLVFPQDPTFSVPIAPQQQSVMPLPAPGDTLGGRTKPAGIDPALIAFQTEFKKIHDLSDHLPLIIDI